MLRRAIPLLLTASSALLAQIGVGLPGTYPGGTYPGGTTYPGGGRYPTGTTYPGSSPYPTSGGGSCPNGRAPVIGACSVTPYPGGSFIPGAYVSLNGNLREIFSSDLVIETDDSRIIRMQIAPNAQFITNFGRGRPSDFNLGDYVTVQAQQDLNNNYLAQLVRLERDDTPEERTAARRPLNVSMHDKEYPGPDDKDADRPHLKRAGSSSDSAKSDAPVETASIAPMVGDPGLPHLHRGAPTPAQSSSDGGGMPPR